MYLRRPVQTRSDSRNVVWGTVRHSATRVDQCDVVCMKTVAGTDRHSTEVPRCRSDISYTGLTRHGDGASNHARTSTRASGTSASWAYRTEAGGQAGLLPSAGVVDSKVDGELRGGACGDRAAGGGPGLPQDRSVSLPDRARRGVGVQGTPVAIAGDQAVQVTWYRDADWRR